MRYVMKMMSIIAVTLVLVPYANSQAFGNTSLKEKIIPFKQLPDGWDLFFPSVKGEEKLT